MAASFFLSWLPKPRFSACRPTLTRHPALPASLAPPGRARLPNHRQMTTATTFPEQTSYYPWSRADNGFHMDSPSVGSPKDGATAPALFTPLKLRELTLKNRIAVSPMCTYSSEDGFFTDWHLVHLGSFALGGAGLILTEATGVCPEGRITPNCTGIWKDEHIAKLKQIADFAHAHGTAIGVQLAHAGRKASTNSPFLSRQFGNDTPHDKNGWKPVAPSEIPHTPVVFQTPTEMTLEQIQEVPIMFKKAAVRGETTLWIVIDLQALKAGMDVVEIHAAHGYLINQFLSPISNTRTDEYGGSFEGRVKLLVEVIKAIREVWDESRPLFVRISATDAIPGDAEQWDLEDSKKLADIMEPLGVDLVDTSSGGNSNKQSIKYEAGYQIPLAKGIKEHNKKILVGAVGALTDAKENNEYIENGTADLIFIGRQLLLEPRWAQNAAETLGVDVHYTLQYAWPLAMRPRRK